MLIRVAKKEDYEDIERLSREVQKMHIAWRPDIYTLESAMIPEQFFEPIIENELMYVADDEGKVKGFVMYAVNNTEIDNHVKRTDYVIDAIAVDKEARGQGIGTKLIDMVKEIAIKNGADGLGLQVNAENEAARAMYEKYGFREKSINMDIKLK